MSYARRRRRHDLTLGDKMEVIRLIDNRTSQTDIAKIYRCSQSQISRIASRREEILADWEKCDDPEQKKKRYVSESHEDGKAEKVPTVTDQSTSPRPPSENTFDGSEQTQKTPESSNNGWIEYWKNHSASFGRRSYGDFDPDFTPWSRRYSSGRRLGRGRPKASANKESRISNQLLDILKNYDLCDVYCADELALHYDAMPSFSNPKNEENEDGGDSEEKKSDIGSIHNQITVFLTCNVTGSDKRDFLIIEDSKKSDSETEVTEPTIAGCHRAKAPHAWMTSDVFKEYLLALDYDLRRQRRYILLLVDNAPPHVPEAGRTLEHIRVLYVRSYATPFFHGIFYSVRSHYRKQILLKLFASNPEFAANYRKEGKGSKNKARLNLKVKIDLEEAVSMLKKAWQSVSPQDIVQCFSKAGICAPHIHGLPENIGDDLPDLPEGFISDEQFEDFVNIDVDTECTGDADLVSAECRILSDLRQRGFTDVGLEPSDETSGDVPSFSTMDNSNALMSTFSPVSMSNVAYNYIGSEIKSEAVDSLGVQRALNIIRNFLQQRNLHLHNLHALEAQISSSEVNDQ